MPNEGTIWTLSEENMLVPCFSSQRMIDPAADETDVPRHRIGSRLCLIYDVSLHSSISSMLRA